jgi:hypothetical protein
MTTNQLCHLSTTAQQVDAWLDRHYRAVQLVHGKLRTVFCGSCGRLHEGDCEDRAHEGPFAVFQEAGGLFSAVPDVFVFDIAIEQVSYEWIPGQGFLAPIPATHWRWSIAVVGKPRLMSTAKRRAAEGISLRAAAMRWLAGKPEVDLPRITDEDIKMYMDGLRRVVL